MAEPVAVIDESGEPNPYLMGVHAPVQDEITAENLKVIGEIPKDLNGVYLRNGPNARFPARRTRSAAPHRTGARSTSQASAEHVTGERAVSRHSGHRPDNHDISRMERGDGPTRWTEDAE